MISTSLSKFNCPSRFIEQGYQTACFNPIDEKENVDNATVISESDETTVSYLKHDGMGEASDNGRSYNAA